MNLYNLTGRREDLPRPLELGERLRTFRFPLVRLRILDHGLPCESERFPVRLSSSTCMPLGGQPNHLTDAQRDDLEEIARSNALPAGLGQRAKIAVCGCDKLARAGA